MPRVNGMHARYMASQAHGGKHSSEPSEPDAVKERDLGPFELPPRSRWYRLQPRGLGTPLVESLHSFMLRLSEAHRVSPVSFLVREMLPGHLGPAVKKGQGLQVTKNIAVHAIGMGRLARGFIDVMERNTMLSDMEGLSLHRWRAVLSSSSLVRECRAWCPYCLQSWLDARLGGDKDAVVFEPLLWAVEVVTLCPVHLRPLQTVCPNAKCNRRVPLLTSKSRVGVCSSCGAWLGAGAGNARNEETRDDTIRTEPSPERVLPEREVGKAVRSGGPARSNSEMPPTLTSELSFDKWVAECVGALLATAHHVSGRLSRADLEASLSKCVCYPPAGDVFSDLCRVIGLPYRMLEDEDRGIKLGVLLHLCYCLGTTPLAFLENSFQPVYASQMKRPMEFERSRRLALGKPSPVRSGSVEQFRQQIQSYVHSCASPPTLVEVALQTGFQVQYLQRVVPDVCAEIVQLRRRAISVPAKIAS
jgi:hypothetical protein